MEPNNALDCPHTLKLHTPKPIIPGEPEPALTPNSWWVERYPEAYHNHGSPFLELTEQSDRFNTQISPVTINTDFMAGALGGRRDLGHAIVYFEPELAWYFKDSDGIFKVTTADKLMNQFRALMMKCAQDMPANVHKLNLVHEWRGDRTCKAILMRAKSILAADSSFFAADSPHQRIRGPELHERLMRVLCETMLQQCENGCLTVTQAYGVFCRLAQQRQLGVLKRSFFRATMQDLLKEAYGISLRHDVPDALGKHQQAWKGVRLVESETLAA
jgi:hypothetical protein